MYLLLADGGFALNTWLLKRVPADQITTVRKLMYNCFLCSPRSVVDNAFGLIKGPWRMMHKGISAETEFVPHVMESCVRQRNF